MGKKAISCWCVLSLFVGCSLIVAGCSTAPTGGGDSNVNDNDNGNVNDNDNTNVNDNDNAGGGEAVEANAGADVNADGGDVVQLDGSQSSSTSGGTLTFAWTQTAGTTVALTGGDSDSPTFTAPNVTETLTFSLAVDDGAGAMDNDAVDVFVTAIQATLFVVNNSAAMTSYAGAGGLDGEIAPTTRLNLGSATSLFQPRSIVVTRDGRLLISRQNGGIVGYDDALTADGDMPADIVVDGNNTNLESPISFAYDATNDRLFVGDADAESGILVFDNVSSTDFNGEVAPSRAFGPPDRIPFTTESITISMTLDAMDLDSDGNLFVSDTSGLNGNQSRILVFSDPGSAEGLVEPAQTFTSDAWSNIEDIVIDADGVLYVVAGEGSVHMFSDASMLAGDVTPSSTLTVLGDLVELEGIVVSSAGTGYLADRSNHAIYTYADLSDLSGSLVPDRTLDGFETRLASPRQMFLLEQ